MYIFLRCERYGLAQIEGKSLDLLPSKSDRDAFAFDRWHTVHGQIRPIAIQN